MAPPVIRSNVAQCLVGGPTEGTVINVKAFSHFLIGLLVFLREPTTRSDQGLSQSAENAILLAGAVAVATVVITAITVFVRSHLPR